MAQQQNPPQQQQPGPPIRPDPDPTVLTTASLLREIENQRNLFTSQLDCVKENMTQLRLQLETRQAAIADAVGHLEKFHGEKFKGVEQRFASLGVQIDKVAELNQKAIDAALQAAEKAVAAQNKASTESIAKSEAGTTKQIDGIGVLIATDRKNSDGKIDDLKGRVTVIEGKAVGSRDNSSLVAAVVMGVIALLGVVLSAVALMATFNRT